MKLSIFGEYQQNVLPAKNLKIIEVIGLTDLEVTYSSLNQVLIFPLAGGLPIQYQLEKGLRGELRSDHSLVLGKKKKGKLFITDVNRSLLFIEFTAASLQQLKRDCRDLPEEAGYLEFFQATHSFEQHTWLNQLIYRLHFELLTTKFKLSSAISFLESELIKETFFSYRKECYQHRHQVMPSKLAKQKFPKELVKALDYLEAQPAKKWLLTELSSLVGISSSTLKRYFSKYLKESAGDFIKRVRLNYAKRLLTESNMSILQISESLNYSSPSAFTYAYKQYFNALPSQLRRADLEITF